MGRKSTEKSKLKKLKRKEETAKLAQKIALINAANLQEDPMAALVPFKKFERNGLKIELNCWRVKNISEKLIDWAFQLTKTNMMRLYENSEWGWSDKLKKEEMTHDNSWFLVAMDASSITKDALNKKSTTKYATLVNDVNSTPNIRNGFSNYRVGHLSHGELTADERESTSKDAADVNSNNSASIVRDVQSISLDSVAKGNSLVGMNLKMVAKDTDPVTKDMKPVAMAHFRFDLENDEEVLYCYEIQLSPEVRRKGLGKFLMQTLELMAFKSEMKKVMLTTFKVNRSAQEFFKKLKYSLDETSPGEDEDGEPCSYEIYSKPIGLRTNIHNNQNNGHAHVHTGCCHH